MSASRNGALFSCFVCHADRDLTAALRNHEYTYAGNKVPCTGSRVCAHRGLSEIARRHFPIRSHVNGAYLQQLRTGRDSRSKKVRASATEMLAMLFKLFRKHTDYRRRFEQDASISAALQRRVNAIDFQPSRGFLKDQRQSKRSITQRPLPQRENLYTISGRLHPKSTTSTT